MASLLGGCGFYAEKRERATKWIDSEGKGRGGRRDGMPTQACILYSGNRGGRGG
ncbi:hypothetical protein LY78DRAFT_202928 [Colletotrichum sublineola]|nr:hypothetical protein LY78DRAFT_202928 [Colletotrichum sublineola]